MDDVAKRGEALWKQQRDQINQRNADAQKKALQDSRTKDDAIQDRERRSASREADQLRALNDRIAKLR
jgi:hypothetical protein